MMARLHGAPGGEGTVQGNGGGDGGAEKEHRQRDVLRGGIRPTAGPALRGAGSADEAVSSSDPKPPHSPEGILSNRSFMVLPR